MSHSPWSGKSAWSRVQAMGIDISALVARLGERAAAAEGWRMTPEELIALLRVEPVRFWRALHEARDKIYFSDAIDGWSQDTLGELVTVVERLGGEGVEEKLTRAGLFLPYTVGIELIEAMLFRARLFAASHIVRTEELAAMLRHTGSVKAALTIYLDTYVDIDALIGDCAESFRVLQGLPVHGGVTAARYLRRMIARHALDPRSLISGLEERLRLEALALGFIDPEDRHQTEEESEEVPVGREASRQRWAWKVMGFDGGSPSAEMLRGRYRQLMMRYHPDADPTGLERCKDVNVAYAILISTASPRG
jgi:hypothetical protein